jgi:hypothetical protein
MVPRYFHPQQSQVRFHLQCEAYDMTYVRGMKNNSQGSLVKSKWMDS